MNVRNKPVFVSVNPLQLSLSFVGKVNSIIPLVGAPARYFTRVYSGLTRKLLYKAGKAWQAQTLELIQTFVNYRSKKFYHIVPSCEKYSVLN
jgi:hypothetical protein